eukprot:gene27717-34481_t
MADTVYEKCLEIVQKKLTVRATVQRRAKNPKSFMEKLKKNTIRQRFHSVDDVFSGISDLAGVRIATYLESDRNTVVEEIRKEFSGRAAGAPEIDVKDAEGVGRHYKATHCQVFLLDDELAGANENLRGTTCEVQVCSLLAHVFNEVEHDLQYKPLTGDLSEQEKEFIDQLGLLTKAGDITIKRLLHEAESRLQGRIGAFADVYDFIARMRVEMGLAEGFAANAGQLFDELMQLELNTPEAISQAVSQGAAQPFSEISLAEYSRLKAFMVADQRQADLLEDGDIGKPPNGARRWTTVTIGSNRELVSAHARCLRTEAVAAFGSAQMSKFLLIAVLVFLSPIACANDVVKVSVGGEALDLPVPVGFVDPKYLAPVLHTRAERLTPPQMRLLAVYVAEPDLSAVSTGSPPKFDSYFMAQVLRGKEAEVLDLKGFASVKSQVRGAPRVEDQKHILADVLQHLDSAARTIGSESGHPEFSMNIGETRQLGVFDETD